MFEPNEAKNIFDYWNDIDARVEDEVKRIAALLRERHPFSNTPVHLAKDRLNKHCFKIRLPHKTDAEFIELLLSRLRDLDWEARIEGATDMGGSHKDLLLSHPSCEALGGKRAAQNTAPGRGHMVDDNDCHPLIDLSVDGVDGFC